MRDSSHPRSPAEVHSVQQMIAEVKEVPQIEDLAALASSDSTGRGGGGVGRQTRSGRGLALLFELELDSGARSGLLEGLQYRLRRPAGLTS